MPRSLLRLHRCRQGTSAVEFGMIAPALVLLLAGLVDFAGAMHQTIRLENAARAGAQYAMSFPEDTAGIVAATTNALGEQGGTVAVVPAYCACPGGGTTAVSCEGTPCDGAVSAVYVEVNITRPYAAVMGIGRFVLPSSLSGTAVTRVR
ncbi:TadE/TadG family type IV pilus assembly protein [Elioraea sp.]|uniref:TadE/TadG family type IV pilus assembly protein n=1 Tax=Elioraea sp. TaxID=2185103 RepID=UPI003F7186F3